VLFVLLQHDVMKLNIHIYFEIKSLIVYYVTRFINGTLITSFIRLERVFNKRVSKFETDKRQLTSDN
jgi:uncharacterized membrane protein YqgA involved in biofilm formation